MSASNSNPVVLRSTISKTIREVAGRIAEEMLDVAAEIARDKKADPNARLKAVGMILDRAAGKPTQPLDINDPDMAELTERWRQAADSAKTVMGSAAPAVTDIDPDTGNVVDFPSDKVQVLPPRRGRRLVLPDED